jgi:hypothetical protein
MARFYFEVSGGETLKHKNDGIDLPDAEAVWIEATTACGEIIRDLDGHLKPGQTWKMVVRDAEGDLYLLEFLTKRLR